MRCDGCNKERRDIQSMGRDSNGDPDAPDLCFICRKEASRSRAYNHTSKAYEHYYTAFYNP
jgi:hypothetical protein